MSPDWKALMVLGNDKHTGTNNIGLVLTKRRIQIVEITVEVIKQLDAEKQMFNSH